MQQFFNREEVRDFVEYGDAKFYKLEVMPALYLQTSRDYTLKFLEDADNMAIPIHGIELGSTLYIHRIKGRRT